MADTDEDKKKSENEEQLKEDDGKEKFSGQFKESLKKGYFYTLFWLIWLGITSPFWVPAKFFNWLKKHYGPHSFGIFIFLVVLFMYFFGYTWLIAVGRVTVGPVYQTVISPALESISPGFKDVLARSYRVLVDPESAREEFDPGAAKEIREGLRGVIFESVTRSRDNYFVGEDVDISTRAKVFGLDDLSTTVKFTCDPISAESLGEVSISGVSGNVVVVPPDIVKSYFVTCHYDLVGISALNAKSEVKKIKFRALYSDYVTKGELDVYTLSSPKLSELEAGGGDVFENVPFDKNLNRKDRSVRPTFSEGPMRLEIDLPASHPLTEIAPYQFFVKIKNDEFLWKGSILRITSLNLKMPNGFNLESDNCDFDADGKAEVGALERINKELGDIARASEEFEVLPSADNSPVRREVKLVCSFTVDDASSEIEKDTIKAGIVYDYEFAKLTTFQINTPVIAIEK